MKNIEKKQREIKFRIWDLYLKQWQTETHKIIWQYGFSGIDRNSGKPVLRFIYKQFTGLLDKNGTAIYEGDIVEWVHFKEKRRGQIIYSVDNMAFICKEQYPYSASGGCMKVIGNIFENSKLLEGQCQHPIPKRGPAQCKDGHWLGSPEHPIL